MRQYEKKRENSRHTAKEHKDEVYDLIPEYKDIDLRITDIALECASKYFDGDKSAIAAMKQEIADLTDRQKALLAQYMFPADYLEEHYECPDCNDTGYTADNKKCHCLTKEILKVLYHQSNIEEVLQRENFDTLSYDYYDDADIDKMKVIIEQCKNFVRDFDSKYENIMLYGNVGVGKTFLTNCMTKELIEKGHSVIYFTSIRLFDTLSRGIFHKDDEDDNYGVLEDVFNCDLLIIDDLGTETINSFVASRLFDILNERDLRKKSTIISTNLPFESISDRYSERNFSRIFGNYKILNPDINDIRIKMRRYKGL